MPTPSEIQTCINNLTTSSQPIDFTLLAAETSAANTGISFSVATVNDLPDLETTNIGEGQIVFVESIGVPVVSTVNEWRGLDGRLLRRDFFTKELFSWGMNNAGQLGDGTTTNRSSPVRENCFATDWSIISASYNIAATKASGQIWNWGGNGCGQLGDGTVTARCSPIRELCSATDWCQVCTKSQSTAAVKTSGQIWTWGSNRCGMLGDGTTVNRCSPVRERCSATDWCLVSAGLFNIRAIKTNGQLWGWGSNASGALADGTVTTRCSPVREFCSATDWCGVSVGSEHAAAIKTSGQIWAWGNNSFYGRLGDGTTVNRCSPVREFCSSTDWCGVSVGTLSAAAIKTSGEIWSWGRGSCGAFGNGSTTSSCSPVREICSATDWCQVSAGDYHTLAVKTSGQLWAWGSNNCGQIGDGTTTGRCSPVRDICSSANWCSISAGGRISVAIKLG